jgi:5-(carboxyamino)imidazole ribonucleotide synthase
MVARDADGNCTCYDPAENRHRSHILDLSIVPARIDSKQSENAQAIARHIAEALGYRGIMGVEFFVTAEGSLIVNEMAPRPHNSGHHTIDACETSQFEQQLRMVLGLSAGATRLHTPVVMLNLLGDMWPEETTPPDWSPLFADGRTHLHLYGKHRARGRRKMGHANILGDSVEDALRRAQALKECLFGQAR